MSPLNCYIYAISHRHSIRETLTIIFTDAVRPPLGLPKKKIYLRELDMEVLNVGLGYIR